MSDDPALVRQWRLSKILSGNRFGASVQEFPFHLPDGFDLAEHLSASFGIFHGAGQVTVRVKFLPAVARYVQESKWHDSQQLTPQKDGSLLAEFQLSDIEEIKRWIMSFGKHAVVMEPEELRAEMREEIQALLTAYGPNQAVRGKTRG